MLVSNLGMKILRRHSPRVRLMMAKKVMIDVKKYRKALRRWTPLLIKRVK